MEYGWSEIYWFTAMRNDSDFVVRAAVYGDMGRDNAQSLPRLQQETQAGHFDLILHVGRSKDFLFFLCNFFLIKVIWPTTWMTTMHASVINI